MPDEGKNGALVSALRPGYDELRRTWLYSMVAAVAMSNKGRKGAKTSVGTFTATMQQDRTLGPMPIPERKQTDV